MPKFGSTADDAVEALATYGRFTAGVSAVFMTMLAAGGVAAGVMLLQKSRTQNEAAAVAVSPSVCQMQQVSTTRGSRTTTQLERQCSTGVSYTDAAGKPHTASVDTDQGMYTAGQALRVYYDPGSADAPTAAPIPKYIGWIVIAISIVVALGSWIWFGVTGEYKAAAVGAGLGGMGSAMQGLGGLNGLNGMGGLGGLTGLGGFSGYRRRRF